MRISRAAAASGAGGQLDDPSSTHRCPELGIGLRRRSGPPRSVPSPAGTPSSTVSPNRSRTSGHAGVDAVVVHRLHLQRRLVQQAVDDGAGDRVDSLEVARRGGLPLAAFSSTTWLGDLRRRGCAAPPASGSTSSEPSQEANCWISSSMIPSAAAPRPGGPCGCAWRRLEVVDVVQRSRRPAARRQRRCHGGRPGRSAAAAGPRARASRRRSRATSSSRWGEAVAATTMSARHERLGQLVEAEAASPW